MKCCIVSVLLLISTVEGSDRFFISAPNVFHVGVKEKVLVQMGGNNLKKQVTLHLEDGNTGALMSAKTTTECTQEGELKTVELMINQESWPMITSRNSHKTPYLNLVAVVANSSDKKITRVLVSNHRGYIFIQTDQPMYNPTQNVNYRVFTLDHMFRPHEETVHISVFNADGNRILKSLTAPEGGIIRSHFPIPSVSKMGTWKITAHYEDDEENAAVREFKVKKFVLPSFEVNIEMRQRYILLNDEQLHFTISAMYSHGEKVKGAYHCQFGVIKKDAAYDQKAPDFIKGLELTGSVQDGIATLNLQLEKINSKVMEQLNQTLSDLLKRGSQLYVGVFVTNIQSGEIQQGEVYIPIISQKYGIDLSRTRSYFSPGYPLDVVVVMRLPDGTPAADVPINITVTADKSLQIWQGITDSDGAVYSAFNNIQVAEIKVKVSADGVHESKIIKRISSSIASLYIAITNKVHSVKDVLFVTFNTNEGPSQGYIYYMILSRGIIIKTGSLPLGTSVKQKIQITEDMVPSFRLIGYYYATNGDIIADSVWVDVRDECEIKVKVEHKGQPKPAKTTVLQLDLNGHSSKVALLAVDKAFYGLNADNKLTAKQVFSTMKSYDLGCTYGGGSNSSSVFVDAGLSFASQSMSSSRKSLGCDSQTARQRRSVDFQQEIITLKSKFEDPDLQDCCTDGFSPIPMRRTCEERATRVQLVKENQTCVDVFLQCCKEAERLQQKKMLEDDKSGLGRTTTTDEIENFFMDTSAQYIRRYFSPSFAFTVFEVKGKKMHYLTLPDSITTWEIQVVTLSPATGLCVVKPHEIKAFKETFVSLRLPYSVKKYEQLSISPVIYNYVNKTLKLAVHMEQTEGLCSPASATKVSYVTTDVKPLSSQLVSFSAVPMVTGKIPIKIRLYDVENSWGIDAVEKSLNVQTEGFEQRDEKTNVVKLDGRSSKTLHIDGTLPHETVPDSSSNIFISIEGDGFGSSHAKNLLSPEKVNSLIKLPKGCLEQTTNRLVPAVLAHRYLDLSDQWFDLPPDARDRALENIKYGYMRIFNYKKSNNGAYGPFYFAQSSSWVTAYIVKVLSMVGERQTAAFEPQGQVIDVSIEQDLNDSVRYLLSLQQPEGSFIDSKLALHRDVQKDQGPWLTAFITLALKRSLQFLKPDVRPAAEASISSATTYLQSQLEGLSHTYAIALTAYCLSVCLPNEADRLPAWKKLQSRAIKDKQHCYLWTDNPSQVNKNQADAITVETTAYALLTAVELVNYDWADQIACWLTSQENYFGGYKSTQDTVMALEALSEYELKRPRPVGNINAEFTVPGRAESVTLALQNKKEKVERDLKKFTGNIINVELTGKGDFKLKTVKAYHVLDPVDDCTELSISVTVEGKVKYTAKIIENYDYYDYDATEVKKVQEAPYVIEHLDALTRSRRDVENSINSDNTVTYTVCVSLNSNTNLSGMAIADISLLSGFEAKPEDLDRLNMPSEQYISHYELSYGRVVLYFNELLNQKECLSFDAVQNIPIGLLQPAPATVYDYYEPKRKCTVFYSAPKRSKMVSKLCSEDVCQCAERPCHEIRDAVKSKGSKKITPARLRHACVVPLMEYVYIVEIQSVSVKSNFELYKANITEVLKFYGDHHVNNRSVRVFARRLHCKGELELGKQYLIMGKDGSTKDSNGQMQYLLESNTWVEKRPLEDDCKKSANRQICYNFNYFIAEYKKRGCTQ
ncbi:complement C4-like [Nematolebias whitei]|uniref:complement C4-like n=1 Tax=Nematolebias whitei TaxID=451745 RepID=UPI001899E9F0|nr:complement C4-like [Nematolebias whitei]